MKLTAESTVFNDDNVKDKFAELEIDADGIRTEVGKKVGNDEVISRINQSAETVKIQASKVEVDGTLIVGKSAVDAAKAEAISAGEKTATNYITAIDENGIRVHPSATENNSAVINADGMEIFRGGTGTAYSVAKYGDTARVGKENAPHVNIGASSISMSDGVRTIYEVKAASSPIVITKIYDHKLDDGMLYEDTIALGREVSSWTKITMTCTVKHGSKTTTYAPTFTSVPIDVETANYSFTLDSASDSSEYTFGIASGTGFEEGDVFTLKSIKFEFSTTQQVVESTLGAFADTSYSGPFRVGKGVSTDLKANAMLIDWAGNAMFGGDISVNCGANSSGGLSLTKDKSTTGAYLFESSTAFVKIDVHQVGMLVMLDIVVSNSTTHAGGTNIASSNLKYAHVPMPVTSRVTGAGYYGNHCIAFAMLQSEDTFDWTLITRNASSSNISVTYPNFIGATLTYVWDGKHYTDEEY